MLESKRLRALGLEPGDHGLTRANEELDPFISAQVSLIENLINESRDENTSNTTLKGPLVFLFDVYNDANHDIADRIRAAKELAYYTHKRIPTTLTLGNDPTDPLLPNQSAIDAVGSLLSKLVDSKHKPAVNPLKKPKILK